LNNKVPDWLWERGKSKGSDRLQNVSKIEIYLSVIFLSFSGLSDKAASIVKTAFSRSFWAGGLAVESMWLIKQAPFGVGDDKKKIKA
jgi:hypothetical protein